MPLDVDPLVAPHVFCEVLRHWVETSPTAGAAAPLVAASDVAHRIGRSSDLVSFERQLLRLASFEDPGTPADTVIGAQVTLDLWYAFGRPAAL